MTEKEEEESDLNDGTVGYWILLATHCCEKVESAPALAWFAYSLAQHCAPPSTDALTMQAARHVLGRGLVAAAVAAARALALWNGADKKDKDDSSTAKLAAILALDRTVHWLPSSSNGGNTTKSPSQQANQVWEQARHSLEQHLWEYWNEETIEFDDRLGSGEQSCLDVLRAATKLPTRQGDAQQTTATTNVQDDITAIFGKVVHGYKIDDYAMALRWVGTALEAYGQARTVILETAAAILQEESSWTSQWECRIVVVPSDTKKEEEEDGDQKMPAATTRSTAAASKRKRPAPEIESADAINSTDLIMPAQVTAVTVVSRLVRILKEISSSNCDRPFSGVLSLYMHMRWPNNNKNKKSKTALPDIRDLVTVIVYRLIDVHFDCLEAYRRDKAPDLEIVNDAADPAELPLTAYYPFLSGVLDGFSWIASNSFSDVSYEESQLIRTRLECLAAAFCFQRCRKESPLDARLMLSTTTQVTRALRRREEHSNVLSQTTGLPEPVLPAVKRKRKSEYCSYAGLFPEAYEHSKTSPSLRSDTKLAIFLRSMGSTNWDERISDLITSLLAMVELCYDTRYTEHPLPIVTVATKAKVETSGEKMSGRGGKKKRKTTKSPAVSLPYRYVVAVLFSQSRLPALHWSARCRLQAN